MRLLQRLLTCHQYLFKLLLGPLQTFWLHDSSVPKQSKYEQLEAKIEIWEDSVSLTPWPEQVMFLKFLAYCNLPPPPLNIPLATSLVSTVFYARPQRSCFFF